MLRVGWLKGLRRKNLLSKSHFDWNKQRLVAPAKRGKDL